MHRFLNTSIFLWGGRGLELSRYHHRLDATGIILHNFCYSFFPLGVVTGGVSKSSPPSMNIKVSEFPLGNSERCIYIMLLLPSKTVPPPGAPPSYFQFVVILMSSGGKISHIVKPGITLNIVKSVINCLNILKRSLKSMVFTHVGCS